MAVRIEFLPGRATTDIVNEVWMEVLAEINQPGSEARLEAEHLGADISVFRDGAIQVEERSRDFGMTIVVSIAIPVAAHIVTALFDDIVRPRIRKRFDVEVGDVVETSTEA